jgi:peptidylprolyl isomerase
VKRLALIVFACLAVVIVGCGSSDDSSTGSSESTATSTESTATSTESSEKSPAESGGSAKESGRVVGRAEPKVTVPSGPPPKKLEIKEIKKGSGKAAKVGDEVLVQYVGVGYESKEEFDSSWSRNEPLPLKLGAGGVIPGWEKGIEGMKVGGRRELIIPPNLAYGPEGRPPVIGPNETLIFVIDLLAVK